MKIKAVYNSKINKKICIGRHTFVNGHPIVIDVDEAEAAKFKALSKQDWFDIIEQYPAPVEETPVEEAPVEETPVEETPVEEAPVEETPVEEAPVEEAPVEETPVEEAPVEETPVEEAPKKKTRKSTKKNAESED